MTVVKPQTLVHQGVVEAAGLFFDLALLGETEARQRVLALWEPGATVRAIAGGLLLRFPYPRIIDCRRAPGVPLTLRKDVLMSAPLSASEWDNLNAPPRTLCLTQNGVTILYPLAEGTTVDPSRWLDISMWPILSTETLGAPIPPPEVFTALTQLSSHAQLNSAPAPSRAILTLLARLKQYADGSAVSKAAALQVNAKRALEIGQQAFEAGIGFLLSPLTLLINVTSLGGGGLMSSGMQQNRAGGANPQSAPPEWLGRLMSQFLQITRLGQLLGSHHAHYLSRLIKMFERGDFAEALRHALPLGGAAGKSGRAWPAFNLFKRRDHLQIQPGLASGGGTLSVSPHLFVNLEQIYRKAFARLEAAGRIDEAAFILSELLRANEEAVAFLERHGRLRLAAEIAEARDLPPGLVVRQWFLANDPDRAVAIARRTGAFADAVTRLEQTNKADSHTLRRIWAGTLAEQGDYSAAVDVAWSIPEHSRILEWIRRAIELGGGSAARMYARWLAREPKAFSEIREGVLSLLAEDAPEYAAAHLAFAEGLMKEACTPAASALARAAIRTLAEDVAQGRLTVVPTCLSKLLQFAGDGALKADFPQTPNNPRPALTSRTTPLEIIIDAADTGATPILDAAWLPNGRCAVALGESGVRLIARDGRTVAHLDQPAHHLVISDAGDRALALAPRGGAMRLARLDFLQRTARSWRDVRIDSWANTYDGSLWFVAAETDLLAIDALADNYKALWRTPEIPGRVTHIARSDDSCSFLIRDGGQIDAWGTPMEIAEETWNRWRLALPALSLRARSELPAASMPYIALRRAVAPGGRIADLRIHLPGENNDASPTTSLSLYDAQSSDAPQLARQIFLPASDQPLDIALSDDWAVAATQTDAAVCCHLIDLKTLTVRLRLHLEGAQRVSMRMDAEYVIIGDDRGRLVVIDLLRGDVMRNLRVG